MLPSHTCQLPGRIWRLVPESTCHYLAVELRQPQAKTAQFAVLTLPGLQLQATPFAGPDPWWCSLAAVGPQVIFLQGYATPDMPQPLGVYAYTHLGQPLWRQPTAVFEALGPAWVQVRSPNGSLVVLDTHTGAEGPAAIGFQAYAPPAVQLPTCLPRGSAAEAAVQTQLAALGDAPPAGAAFHLWQGQGTTVLSFAVDGQRTVVVYRTGRRVFQRHFPEQGNAAREPFVCLGTTLVFTPAIGDIVAVELPL